jgi:hypothetical protein
VKLSLRVIQYLDITDEGDITQQRTTANRAGIATPDQDVITLTTYTTGGKNLRLPAPVTQTLPDGTVIGAMTCCSCLSRRKQPPTPLVQAPTNPRIAFANR